MKNRVIVTGSLMGAVLLGVLYVSVSGVTPQRTALKQDGSTKMLLSALRTEPNFINDTYDSTAIIRGTVVAIDTAPDQVLNHNKHITLFVDSIMKGPNVGETVDVYTFGDSESVAVEDHEKIVLAVGDSGVFFLDWMPQNGGFYTFFGGPRGVRIERDGKVADWNGHPQRVDDFLASVQKLLATPDTRPASKTLGDQIREVEGR